MTPVKQLVDRLEALAESADVYDRGLCNAILEVMHELSALSAQGEAVAHPNGIAKAFYGLTEAIEQLPASEQQTKCVLLAGQVRDSVIQFIEASQDGFPNECTCDGAGRCANCVAYKEGVRDGLAKACPCYPEKQQEIRSRAAYRRCRRADEDILKEISDHATSGPEYADTYLKIYPDDCRKIAALSTPPPAEAVEDDHLMLFGVLEQPLDFAFEGPIAQAQYWSRAQEAVRLIRALESAHSLRSQRGVDDAMVERFCDEYDPHWRLMSDRMRADRLHLTRAALEAAGRG